MKLPVTYYRVSIQKRGASDLGLEAQVAIDAHARDHDAEVIMGSDTETAVMPGGVDPSAPVESGVTR